MESVSDDDLKSLFAENRRHFDVILERVESRFDAVAESLSAGQENLERKIDDLDERMKRGFEETQSMLRFSHAELERRMRSLEDTVADL